MLRRQHLVQEGDGRQRRGWSLLWYRGAGHVERDDGFQLEGADAAVRLLPGPQEVATTFWQSAERHEVQAERPAVLLCAVPRVPDLPCIGQGDHGCPCLRHSLVRARRAGPLVRSPE